jgi:hypothetical protein
VKRKKLLKNQDKEDFVRNVKTIIWMKKATVVIVERKQEKVELSSSNIAEIQIALKKKSQSS